MSSRPLPLMAMGFAIPGSLTPWWRGSLYLGSFFLAETYSGISALECLLVSGFSSPEFTLRLARGCGPRMWQPLLASKWIVTPSSRRTKVTRLYTCASSRLPNWIANRLTGESQSPPDNLSRVSSTPGGRTPADRITSLTRYRCATSLSTFLLMANCSAIHRYSPPVSEMSLTLLCFPQVTAVFYLRVASVNLD